MLGVNVMFVIHCKTFAEVLGDRETSAEKTGQPKGVLP
jgi:hypothetical protein